MGMEEGNLPVISMKLGNNASFRFDVVSHHIKETDFSVILLLDFFPHRSQQPKGCTLVLFNCVAICTSSFKNVFCHIS